MDEMGGARSTHRGDENYIQNFSQNNLKGTECGGPGHRWEDNINIDITEIGCENVDYIHLVQDRDEWWAPS
jgi:hypothetical protein